MAMSCVRPPVRGQHRGAPRRFASRQSDTPARPLDHNIEAELEQPVRQTDEEVANVDVLVDDRLWSTGRWRLTLPASRRSSSALGHDDATPSNRTSGSRSRRSTRASSAHQAAAPLRGVGCAWPADGPGRLTLEKKSWRTVHRNCSTTCATCWRLFRLLLLRLVRLHHADPIALGIEE
jgi:hypothetical protein